MRRIRLAARAVVRRDLLLTGGDIQELDGTLEQCERGLRLVVGHLMAGFVDAGEGEVAVFARLAVLHAAVGEGSVAGRGELFAVGVVEREGDSLPAKPVANVISIAVEAGQGGQRLSIKDE